MPKGKTIRNLFYLVFGCFVFGFCFRVNALTISSTYRDISPNNTNASNLLALAENYDTFKDSKFVIFSDSSDSYYIVWGNDLSVSNNVVSGSKIEYLRYYRISSGYSYQYVYGTDTIFRLSSSYYNTSNINGYGFLSLDSKQFDFYYYGKYFLILITSMVFICAVTSLKRSVTI